MQLQCVAALLFIAFLQSGQAKTNIKGRILDLHGYPIENAQVHIYEEGALIFTSSSNKAGEYTIKLNIERISHLRLFISSLGFLDTQKDIWIKPGEERNINFGLQLGKLIDTIPSKVKVIIKDVNGKRLKGVDVVARSPFTDDVIVSGITNHLGECLLTFTEGGQYILFAFSPYFKIQALAIVTPTRKINREIVVTIKLSALAFATRK